MEFNLVLLKTSPLKHQLEFDSFRGALLCVPRLLSLPSVIVKCIAFFGFFCSPLPPSPY